MYAAGIACALAVALPATPIRGTQKSDLIANIAAECDTLANRQRILA